jgi:hypothetical protein
MNAAPPPLPDLQSVESRRSRRNTVVLLSGAFGLLGGGVLGYCLSRAWAEWATQDPEWDGGMAVLVVYGIIAVATIFTAIVGAALSMYLGYRIHRRRR